MPPCDHASGIAPIAIFHVSLSVALLGARFASVPLWHIPSAAAAYVPIVETFEQGLWIAPSLLIGPSRS